MVNSEIQSELDSYGNKILSSQTRSKLLEIEQHFVKDQLAVIYESFATLTHTKLMQDTYEFKIDTL